jgi:hypothetical protein
MPGSPNAAYGRAMTSTVQRTFLVESYVPNLDEATAAELSVRLRSTIADLRREGLKLRWLRSFALLNAADVDQVVVVNERAAVGFDHVAEVAASESQ